LTEEGGPRPPRMLGERNNAALEYFQIWDTVSRAERTELSDAVGMNGREDGARLDKNSRRLCELHRDYIEALVRNAGSGDCDWGVNVEAGWMCLLPHLSWLRGSARIIRMDTYRCIDDGSYAAAAERMAAVFQMSNQTRSDQIMISALVGAAICGVGLNVTEDMVRDHQLSPASARIILNAVKALPRDDIFGSASAIQRERYCSVEWARQHYKGEHAGFLMMREDFGARLSGEDPLKFFIYGMNEERLGADLDRFNRYFDAAAAAWRKPDNEVLLRELSVEVWEGQFGMVARVMAPSIERVCASISKTRGEIDRLTRELEAIVHANDSGAAAPAGAGK